MRHVRQETTTEIVKRDSMATAVAKVSVFGGEPPTATAFTSPEDINQLYSIADIIVPPYEPLSLCAMYDRSAILRPNIDAYAVNIEAFGHRLVPRVDLDKPDAADKVRDAILLERIYDGAPPSVDKTDVDAQLMQLPAQLRIERLKLETFFESCVPTMSFVELRERTRIDIEVTGNGYWEVLRDRGGDIAQFEYVPSVSMRLLRADPKFTEVETNQRITAISYRKIKSMRRFRRFVQYIRGFPVVFFKELDDPRTLSSKTGRYYDSIDELARREPGIPPANEIVHFKIHSPTSVYGVPRWVGAMLAVIGSRSCDEVNVTYFDNKAVPPLAILVSGGRLADGSADRIKDYIRDHLKGKENFHSVLVLEAEGAAGAGGSMTGGAQARVRIEVKPLMDAQQKDALFQAYDQNNAEKVGNQFRLPRIIRGNSSDYNRATAQAALQYAEQQVFQPERSKIDFVIDHRILAAKGVRFHEFQSNSPDLRDSSAITANIVALVEACVITPAEARVFAADVFNEEIHPITEPWTRMPPKLFIAGTQPKPSQEELDEAKKLAADTKGSDKPIPSIALAPTDAAIACTVNEARASLKLGPLTLPDGREDPDGTMTMAAYRAKMGAPASPPGVSTGKALQELVAARKALDEVRDLVEGNVRKSIDGARLEESERVIKIPADEFARWVIPDPSEHSAPSKAIQ